MTSLLLSLASKHDSLHVVEFSVRERMSGLFEVDLIAGSELEDIDFDSIVGKGAAFKIVTELAVSTVPSRVWTGIVSHMEQVHGMRSGHNTEELSTYYLRIVPDLWRLTLRKNSRIFQHKSIPEIVTEVLAEWKIEPRTALDDYPKLEYKVQYEETDFAFVSRLLEEAGITYHFEFQEDVETALVLTDRPNKGNVRGGALQVVDESKLKSDIEFAKRVRLMHQMRPGSVTMRDFDFRTKPDVELLGKAKVGADEARYEQYSYVPSAFLVEGATDPAPVANDPGSRFDADEASRRANRVLEELRRDRRQVHLETNVHDLAPGTVFVIKGHPHPELGRDGRLLVEERRLRGALASPNEWVSTVLAYFASDSYRPVRTTPKPRVHGLQSALVVGPGEEEIYTDEFGRVRVQFHWDREGKRDEKSSCWIRVSQGWAGSRYGMVAIPRVGQEVLVEFFEGDPDCPVITGRVYNNTTRVPYKLPQDKTISGWKSDTSRGSGGYNELYFDDARGRELVALQAERNLRQIVKVDEVASVGAHRVTTVGKVDATYAGETHIVQVAEGTGTLTSEGRIVLATGFGASLVLVGDRIELDATNIVLRAGAALGVHASSQNLVIEGAPKVGINCGRPEPPQVMGMPARLATGPGGVSVPADKLLEPTGGFPDPGGFEEAAIPPDPPSISEVIAVPPSSPREAPAAVKLEPQVNEGLSGEAESVAASPGPPTVSRALLVRERIGQGMSVVSIGRDIVGKRSIAAATSGAQLLLGAAMTKPIPMLGGLNGGDVAEVMNVGSALGVFQFGGAPTAAPQRPVETGAARPVATPGIAGTPRTPGGGTLTEKLIADGGGQYLVMRTQASPESVDPVKLDTQREAYESVGMPPSEAAAKALEQQGLALYEGRFDGNFSKVASDWTLAR